MCARWAYYTDQASRGVLLSQNLAYDIKCAAFHQHYGVENIVDNNVFAFVNDEAGVRKPAYRGALVGGVALGSWQVALPWWVRLFHDKLFAPAATSFFTVVLCIVHANANTDL